jgi:hypothetical protein
MGAMATITLPVTSNADPGSLHSAATLQLRQYIQRRYQNGIRSKKQGIWPRTAAGPILFVAAHESLVGRYCCKSLFWVTNEIS